MEIVAVIILVVVLAMVAGCWYTLFQLVAQQGRILLRLDELEEKLAATHEAVMDTASRPAPIAHRVVEGRDEPEYAQPSYPEPDRGVPVGAPLPGFRLPDVTGRSHTLEGYRGRGVLLVHWSTQCGYCDMMAPELSALQPRFAEAGVQLLLVGYGDAEANIRMASEYGFTCPVLLQKPGETIEAFSSFGTPVAYFVDGEGRVAAPLAVGADQVPSLARLAAESAVHADAHAEGHASNGIAHQSNEAQSLPGARPLSESKIPRDGLPAGTTAPPFTLPDVYGRTVSLEQYRGRRVLLVFSDPNCGPCDELAPHLARLDREHRNNNLAVVMIGRGDIDENRKKAEQFGLEFPVVMQEKWKLSKEYGIFATPVGYLIGEDGVLRSDVAMGGGAILSLVGDGH